MHVIHKRNTCISSQITPNFYCLICKPVENTKSCPKRAIEYKCKTCQYKFKSKFILNRHMKTQHNGMVS